MSNTETIDITMAIDERKGLFLKNAEGDNREALSNCVQAMSQHLAQHVRMPVYYGGEGRIMTENEHVEIYNKIHDKLLSDSHNQVDVALTRGCHILVMAAKMDHDTMELLANP